MDRGKNLALRLQRHEKGATAVVPQTPPPVATGSDAHLSYPPPAQPPGLLPSLSSECSGGRRCRRESIERERIITLSPSSLFFIRVLWKSLQVYPQEFPPFLALSCC